ncbi:RNA-binding protein 34 [Salvelinus sp. IW2-2015]|uniref:RNA-binding protein 34 n=1 Tax=Salvelinus sp. IW2-2015 TaxID=2691554 RepID=UPI000CDFE578|nr:RNA-binding protein 34 [Salvelinus alpinus]XP_023838306.1 RNA-binding protein 34 [Salvelinus alpinus]
MKRKFSGESEGPSVDKQPIDYVVGSVSGSLFPKESASSSGSLSALFQAAPVVDTLFFVPAPKPEPRSVEVKEGAVTKVPNNQKQTKKAARDKSAADLNLENRESALQNAYKAEQVPKMPKKTKRKAVEMGEGGATEEERQTKNQTTAGQFAEARVKQKRTVFVGNLPASCTKKTLQLVFKDQGAIESIRFRSVVREDPSMSRKVATIQRKVHPKKQTINAYVVFKAEEGAEKALERNGMEIEKNVHIRVDRVSKSTSHDHKRSIFIGNLPFDINELPLRQHFEECGKVEGVRLVRDKTSGMGKGFGYILFQSIDAVQLALKLDGSTLLGRSVRVKRSVKKEKEKKKVVHRGPRGKEPTKGGFKGRPGQGGPQNKSSGRPQGKGPQMKSTGKPFKKNPGEAQKATTGPSSFKGEMADPNSKKAKAKALKKKLKPRKRNQVVHI